MKQIEGFLEISIFHKISFQNWFWEASGIDFGRIWELRGEGILMFFAIKDAIANTCEIQCKKNAWKHI